MKEILNKLESEIKRLKIICDKQFEERFSISKHKDKWSEDLFQEYQTCIIRIELLNEMLSKLHTPYTLLNIKTSSGCVER